MMQTTSRRSSSPASHKITLTIDRPKLSPEDIKKLEASQRAVAKGREQSA